MKRIVILCSIFMGTFSMFGQNTEPVEGTYQIIINSPDKREMVFTTDFISSLDIENLRQDFNDTTIVVNPIISVYIPSKAKIEAADFVKLDLKKYE